MAPRLFEPAVLVPIKALTEAKSRFRAVLDEQTRAELVRGMLTDVLAAVRGAYAGPLHLVTSDDAYDDIRVRFDARRLPDLGSDYNSAVAGALRSSPVIEAGAAVVLPADLPRATSVEIAMAIEALREAEVVLVAASDGGTGMLGLRPPDAIMPAFGDQSARAHLQAAADARLRVGVLNCASLAHDVDVPADLAHDPGSFGKATLAFLATHRFEVPTGGSHGRR